MAPVSLEENQMGTLKALCIFSLVVCVAFSAEAARSKKLQSGAAKNGGDAVAGMRPYTPAEIAAYNRGVTALDAKDYAQARKHFEEALALDEEFPEAHNNLAYSLRMHSLDNADTSLQHYNRALELAPKFPQALYYRGVLFVQLGRAADAEKDRAALEALGIGEPKEYAAELAKVIKAGKAKKNQDALSIYGNIAQ